MSCLKAPRLKDTKSNKKKYKEYTNNFKTYISSCSQLMYYTDMTDIG